MKLCIQSASSLLVPVTVIACLWGSIPVQAQIASDNTTDTLVNTSLTLSCTTGTCSITGGRTQGANLFHSFAQFSVPTGTTAIFDYTLTPSIQNIFARVTGGFSSNINGTITTAPAGRVSLFLLNPAGISFGTGASLNVGGSFIATTANSIRFADGSEFRAAVSTPSPLTVSVPIGLQFGGGQGNININVGGLLEVPSDNTLAFVGGSVDVQNSILRARSGRVELGAIANQNQVTLTPVAAGWMLGYSGVSAFQNIQMRRGSPGSTTAITTNGAPGSPVGSIQIVGQDITLVDRAFIQQQHNGSTTGGDTVIQAQGSLVIRGDLTNATIVSRASGTGAGGNIRITANRLIMQNAAQILADTSGVGNTGSITIDANQVSIESGSQVRTETPSGTTGNGGALTVRANQVRVTGVSPTNNQNSSAFFAQTSGSGAAGNLTITTRQLTVDNGGQISASTFGSGQGGALSISATGGSVQVIGAPNRPVGAPNSAILSQSLARTSAGGAGSVSINTDRLILQNGGAISVSSNAAAAGNLVITSPFISLDGQSNLQANTAGVQSNLQGITLQTRDLRLRRGSFISTDAIGTSTGGNIRISTATLVALENSDITANAIRGPGGQVSIRADGIFGTAFRDTRTPKSDITATSELGPDFSGTVTIQTPAVDPSRGLLQLAPIVVDPSKLISRECSPKSNQSTGEFIVTGRGGLPPSPSDALENDGVLVDLGRSVPSGFNQSGRQGTVAQSRSNTQQNSLENSPGNSLGASVTEVEAIAQAQGWMVNAEGKVVLLAQTPMTMPLVPWLTPPPCHAR